MKKLESDIWPGHKLQEILWSGKIKEEEGWEEKLLCYWKEIR